MRRFSAVLLILFCLARSRHASWLSSGTRRRFPRVSGDKGCRDGGEGSVFSPSRSAYLTGKRNQRS